MVRSVGIVVFSGNKTLLVRNVGSSRHVENVYGLAAGRLEHGEDEIDAAVRELKEETGLSTTRSDLVQLPTVYRATLPQKDGTTVDFLWTVFLCKKYTGDLAPSDETIPEWVEVDKLDDHNLIANVKDAICEVQKIRKETRLEKRPYLC